VFKDRQALVVRDLIQALAGICDAFATGGKKDPLLVHPFATPVLQEESKKHQLSSDIEILKPQKWAPT
jgi:hypothetical protein